MYVTYLLIGINIVVFLLIMTQNLDVNRFIYNQNEIKYHKEWYRMITSGFMHVAVFHIAFNMYALYGFGEGLEFILTERMGLWSEVGRIAYLGIFILSVLGGSFFCYAAKSREPNYLALGASGGVFGVVYAMVLILPQMPIGIILIPIDFPGWGFAIVVTLVSIFLSLLPKGGNISHEGHLGGAVIGALLMLVIMQVQGVPLQPEAAYFLLFGVLPAFIFLLFQMFWPQKVDELKYWIQRNLPRG